MTISKLTQATEHNGNKVVVIKCGGSVIESLAPAFFKSLHELKKQGWQFVFVHGGGPDINKLLALYDVAPEFHNGLRKTSAETMQVVEMVLTGQTNRKLAELLGQYDFNPIGLSGSDGNCLKARFINKKELGFVGEVIEVNKSVINMLLKEKFTPVITPVGVTADGTKLNINADYAAAAVAHALQAECCIFVTDVEGIIIGDSVVSHLTPEDIDAYILEGQIYGGMIPKVESALAAVKRGVKNAMIVSGKGAIYQDAQWKGTTISRKAGYDDELSVSNIYKVGS
ncbi:acetylglutamate kinase [Bacillus sp. V3-13]|uniref:acetylglutamate kinase n=1 Tax=Bacillus sp. V3-13 TaxID=2053728 RepID=UPI000C75EBB6|nr:acetylglutamate kinase [Bacillus sp. V3-13]PLR78845.1 acetylglutamate kinase [Bacillus sp. V3-13]